MQPKPIAETISYLLAQVCRTHRNKANDLLTELDLHAGQEMFLLNLWQRDGLTQSELADCMCIQPATITRMLDRIEKVGLVERRKDAEDQRVSRVYLTEAGRSLQRPVEAMWHKLESISMTSFTLEEQILLRRLLLQVHDNLTR
jgi:DNA-binding MarR family transcriptional regulator